MFPYKILKESLKVCCRVSQESQLHILQSWTGGLRAFRTSSTSSGALPQTNTTRGSTTQSVWWCSWLCPCWFSSPCWWCAATAAAVAMTTAAVAAAAVMPWQPQAQKRRRKRIRQTLKTCGSRSRRSQRHLTGLPWLWCRNTFLVWDHWSWASWCHGTDGSLSKVKKYFGKEGR